MKKHEVEKRIQQAFSNVQVPDVLESVLSDCEKEKGYIMMKEEKKNPWIKGFVYAAIIMLAFTGVLGFNFYQSYYKAVTTIAFDVNPSIEIKTNDQDRVLEVKALNEDGEIVIGDMNLKGCDMNVAVNALIGSMIQNGYLSDLANSILISVENHDPEKTAQLQKKLSDEIYALINSNHFDGAVLSLSIENDDELRKLAETYGITVGKAQFIQNLIVANPLYSFDSLAKLTIHELNLLAHSSTLEHVSSNGNASDKNYIGKERAKEIALQYVKVNENEISHLEIEIDYEMGLMIYEVEFQVKGLEYDIDINAKTGEVVHTHSELEDDEHDVILGNSSYIGESKAKEIALNHALVSENQIDKYWIELKAHHGQAVYEIEFMVGNTEYEYKIQAENGTILQAEKEDENVGQDASYIGESKAKNIALSYMKVSASDVKNLKIHLDQEHDTIIYEVEFYVGSKEYEVKINAKTGAVIHSEKEH